MCLSLCLSQATISTFKRLTNLELNIGPEACHSFIDEHTFICYLTGGKCKHVDVHL